MKSIARFSLLMATQIFSATSSLASISDGCISEGIAIAEAAIEETFEGNESFSAAGPQVSTRELANGYRVTYSRKTYDTHHGAGASYQNSITIDFDVICRETSRSAVKKR